MQAQAHTHTTLPCPPIPTHTTSTPHPPTHHHTLPDTLSHTHPPTHTLTLIPSQTHSHTLTRTHTLAHTQSYVPSTVFSFYSGRKSYHTHCITPTDPDTTKYRWMCEAPHTESTSTLDHNHRQQADPFLPHSGILLHNNVPLVNAYHCISTQWCSLVAEQSSGMFWNISVWLCSYMAICGMATKNTFLQSIC